MCGSASGNSTGCSSEHVGMPPGRFVRHTRLDAAARLLSTTSHPFGTVAGRCGFGTIEALRQAAGRGIAVGVGSAVCPYRIPT
jgi:AraC-like DNA-binding protein